MLGSIPRVLAGPATGHKSTKDLRFKTSKFDVSPRLFLRRRAQPPWPLNFLIRLAAWCVPGLLPPPHLDWGPQERPEPWGQHAASRTAPSPAPPGRGPRAWRWHSLRRDRKVSFCHVVPFRAGDRLPGKPRLAKKRSFWVVYTLVLNHRGHLAKLGDTSDCRGWG